MTAWRFSSDGEKQTQELGFCLGRLIEQPALLLLQGELGAGKSVFARGIARGLGVPPEIPITSPTFTLMNHYSARLDLYHFDLYRLSDPDELIDIGFDEYAFDSGVALIEWPERLQNNATPGLWVQLQHAGGESRELRFLPRGQAAETLLQRLQMSCSETTFGGAKDSEKAFDRL